ncbi:MAG: hypothetical protein NTV14_05815 [Coprothermobacterota bacterium]|nr:hypothetical protein [Coprothermobacterota bacterium]
MTLDPLTLEKWIDWCAHAPELAIARYQAWRIFFDLDDPGQIEYINNSGALEERERRFLSWFCLDHLLPNDALPIEQAIRALVLEPKRAVATGLVHRSRYLLGVVKDILPGVGTSRATGCPQAFFLQVNREQLGVYSTTASASLQRGEGVILTLVPNGSGGWVAAPGWVRWPTSITPALRRQLRGLRFNPLQVERYLQCRPIVMVVPRNAAQQMPSKGLAEAVQRMSDAARELDEEGLVLSSEEWQDFALPYLMREKPSPQHYIQQLLTRVLKAADTETLNRVVDLAMDIWNHTPQPDRAGKSAYQLDLESKPAEKARKRSSRKEP